MEAIFQAPVSTESRSAPSSHLFAPFTHPRVGVNASSAFEFSGPLVNTHLNP